MLTKGAPSASDRGLLGVVDRNDLRSILAVKCTYRPYGAELFCSPRQST
jgi:hypothetical protein